VYLTTQYNNSMVETYVLAKASSIVNNSFESWRPDLIHQVQEDFLPFYGNRNSSKWQPFNTLFIIFIGINDVDVSLNQTISVSETFDQIMVTYSALVDQVRLYFLHFNHIADSPPSYTKQEHKTYYS